MTDNRQAIAMLPNSQDKNLQRLDRVSLLFSVLSPIRPAGMNDEVASDWCAVIIADCQHLSDGQFHAGCDHAKRECFDHRGVRRAILNRAEKMTPRPFAGDWDKALRDYSQDYPAKQITGGARSIGRIIKQ